ncbi:MAG: hypothetical protein MUE36_01405 [Acidimicrobiales bacterium]|jgi:hypothetical protein|nr:hypothetical protein [Acidimicrobiales bacterium]
MFKRVTWFTIGAAVGAGGTVVGYLRARELARRHVPVSVHDAASRAAEAAATEAGALAGRAAETVDEWRARAATAGDDRRRAERILRAELDRAGL